MNQNYDQVAELITAGKLSWERDAIIAMLYTNLTFDAANKLSSELTGEVMATQRIDGRFVLDGGCFGLPVAFQKVPSLTPFQIVVAQDIGNRDPNVLAFIDVNADDSDITVQHVGTLIIRPVLAPEEHPGHPSNVGVWLRLPA